MENTILTSNFSSIYVIAVPKNIKIEEPYKIINGKVTWMVNVSRNLNDWEVTEYECPLKTLESRELCGNWARGKSFLSIYIIFTFWGLTNAGVISSRLPKSGKILLLLEWLSFCGKLAEKAY